MNFPDISCDPDVENHESAAKVIYDEPVVCRAKATLPSSFLYIKHSKTKKGVGVYARKEIPFKTLFGPLEGVMVEDDGNRSGKRFHYLVEVDGSFRRLDISNEFLSNWMRYVKAAKTYREQNLAIHQQGENLYFSTTRAIKAKEELKVWYSSNYALSRRIKISIDNEHRTAVAPIKNDWSIDCMNVDFQPLLNNFDCLWPCTHCQLKFKSATLLNFHMLTHAADNIETNKQIDLSTEKLNFDSIDLMGSTPVASVGVGDHPVSSRITETPPKGKTFECPICNTVFIKLVSLKQHVHSHSINGTFTCPTCSKAFRTYKLVRNHIRIYHSVRRFECDVCPKRFPTQNKLKHHKLRHTGHKPYLCSECGKQFKRRDKLNNHIKRTHDDGAVAYNKRPCSPRKRKNELCVSGEGALESLYRCQMCGTGFKRRGMLVNHLASRHPDIPVESVSELKLPILKADKEYFCQYCDKVYKSTSKRKSHILKNHPGKQLPERVRKLATTETEVDDPRVSNRSSSQDCGSYSVLPRQCSWCHKQYASRAKLLQHQRKAHLDLMPKSLQEPKKFGSSRDEDFDENEIEKVDSGALLLQNPLEENLSEYECHLGDSKLPGDGEFIIDAPTLRRVLKGDAVTYECSPETLLELGQILDTRPDQYFRILQTPNGISFARPIEFWDPCQSLSPEAPHSDSLVV